MKKEQAVIKKRQAETYAELKDLITSTMTETKESGINHIDNFVHVF